MKPGYKSTEVGVIPDDWSVVSLDEVSSSSSGATPARSLFDRYYADGGVHWVKTMDLNNGDILDTDEKVTSLALSEANLRLNSVGTVLVAMYGGYNQIGRTGILKVPAATNQAMTAIWCNGHRLFPRFLLDVLNFRVGHWRSVASSSRKDPNITGADVRGFLIQLPGVDEQVLIADALGDVDALLAGLDKLIAKKRDIKQATMQQLLTCKIRLHGFTDEWEVRRLAEVLTIRHGKNQSTVSSVDGDYPILASGGRIGMAKQWLYDKPSVLIGRKGTIDRPQYMDAPFWTVDTLFYSEIKGGGCAKFFYYRFCLIDWMKYNEASGVPSLNARTIEAIELGLPGPAEQQAIAGFLSALDAELDQLEAQREKTRLLKQGMMQQLLTGRTRLV